MGSSLLVVLTAAYSFVTGGATTDSQSNAWTFGSIYGTLPGIQMSWCTNPTTSSSHTFTVGGSGNGYFTIAIAGFAGTLSGSTVDVNTGAAASQPGSATPAHNGELIVTAVASNTPGTYAVDSGFTITDQISYVNSHYESAGLAYLIQPTAASVNPTWSGIASSRSAMVSFQAAAGLPPAPQQPMVDDNLITVCALMRNESQDIARMVRSAQAVLGSQFAGAVLADTGSTDDGIGVARAACPDAVIVQHEWQDFATNRNLLLDVAYEQGAEWVLMLDPDMTLEGELPELQGLGYEVEIHGVGNAVFTHPRLLSTQRRWRYEGVVHEALADYPGLPRLNGLRIRHHGSTDHREDGRFERDREALQGTLNPRSLFYLAQTERDLGNTEKAAGLYELRASMGGWSEEVYYSLLQAGILGKSLETLLKAWEYRPSRGEALWAAIGILRDQGSWRAAHMLTTAGLALVAPPREDVLWVEPWVYAWALRFEHAVTCFHVGKYAECATISDEMATRYDVPLNYRQQAVRNRNLAQQHLPPVGPDETPLPVVAILVPVLNRPHRVEPFLRDLRENTPEPHRVIFGVSEGDEETIRVLDQSGAEYLTVPESEGTYARKINALYNATDEPYVFLAADDYRFTPGWLTQAHRAMRDVEGVIAPDDLCNNLGTCCLVSRKYVEEQGGTADSLGAVFHDSYRHNFCDMELFETAKARGKYRWCGDSIVEHLHPVLGKSERDSTYALGDSTYALDEALYVSRQHLWAQ